jgi:hypothetical protein
MNGTTLILHKIKGISIKHFSTSVTNLYLDTCVNDGLAKVL